jgi:hypothetical protein
MKRNDEEFCDLMYEFEKSIKALPIYTTGDFSRSKDNRYFYNNGFINNLFIAYMAGYQLAKAMARIGDLKIRED